MKTIKQLTLEDVKKMGAAAEAEAQKQGWAVSVAIADAGGHLLWFQRGDGAPAMSATIAPDKARTSALSGRVSQDLEDMVNNGRTAALSMPIVPLGGGLPIIVDGVVIGGIGVSGVLPHEDAQVADAGVKALG
ncbi:MAG TPA: heme-binding protein [Paenalcaligenes sp.]|nr:heme-binding protein [Paenalcaligenes sp.]